MTATPALTTALQRQVLLLEDDLRARVDDLSEVRERWTAEHAEALKRGRMAAAWPAWRDDRVTQVAVAWVLVTVFVRFCEDNGLVRPVWIAGPEARRQEALDAQRLYFREHPEHTDREWIEQAIDYLAALPATAGLVDQHNPLHLVGPSGDAASVLLDFWRARDESGRLVHDLTDDKELSTRFLGDLYQDLSQHAKEAYALLQTPEFVEEFLLDRMMEPALAERPLEGFRLIDPTCGSGHFLLGAFARLLDRWAAAEPGTETRERVRKALDAIHGVDVNAFAVEITRFRLIIAAMKASLARDLEDRIAFTYHLATGDSLIHGPGQQVIAGLPTVSGHTYSWEEQDRLNELLDANRYDVVMGNPPYITVKERRRTRSTGRGTRPARARTRSPCPSWSASSHWPSGGTATSPRVGSGRSRATRS